MANVKVLLLAPKNEGCSRNRLFTHGASCKMDRVSGGDGLAAGKTAETQLDGRSIATDHGDVVRPNADLIGGDLRHHGLEALTHRDGASENRGLPGTADAHNGRFERATSGTFQSHGDPAAENATLGPRILATRRKTGRIGARQSKIEACREVAAFVHDGADRPR